MDSRNLAPSKSHSINHNKSCILSGRISPSLVCQAMMRYALDLFTFCSLLLVWCSYKWVEDRQLTTDKRRRVGGYSTYNLESPPFREMFREFCVCCCLFLISRRKKMRG